MTNNPYAKIKTNSIMTASPEELTLMLYDGAIKYGNQAKLAMLEGEIEKSHRLSIRVQDIIEEFQATLDTSYEVAKDFDLMYDYIARKLVESNIKKDVEVLDEAIGFIREMRNIWKEAMQTAKTNVSSTPSFQTQQAQ